MPRPGSLPAVEVAHNDRVQQRFGQQHPLELVRHDHERLALGLLAEGAQGLVPVGESERRIHQTAQLGCQQVQVPARPYQNYELQSYDFANRAFVSRAFARSAARYGPR
jgi:hypothetical protein